MLVFFAEIFAVGLQGISRGLINLSEKLDIEKSEIHGYVDGTLVECEYAQ